MSMSNGSRYSTLPLALALVACSQPQGFCQQVLDDALTIADQFPGADANGIVVRNSYDASVPEKAVAGSKPGSNIVSAFPAGFLAIPRAHDLLASAGMCSPEATGLVCGSFYHELLHKC